MLVIADPLEPIPEEEEEEAAKSEALPLTIADDLEDNGVLDRSNEYRKVKIKMSRAYGQGGKDSKENSPSPPPMASSHIQHSHLDASPEHRR
ncbi:unnamed protein product, partial [Nesidiocoris tenuis]